MRGLINVVLCVLNLLLSLLFDLLFLWAERHPSSEKADHCANAWLQLSYWHLISAIFNVLGQLWLPMLSYLVLDVRDIQILRDYPCSLIRHLECMKGVSTTQVGSPRSQWCRWLKACSLTFCFRSSVVLPHDMSPLTLRMYLRARTVAAAEESIHERLEVVQNHASNLFIWIHGSFACMALCLVACTSYIHAAPCTITAHLALQGIA